MRLWIENGLFAFWKAAWIRQSAGGMWAEGVMPSHPSCGWMVRVFLLEGQDWRLWQEMECCTGGGTWGQASATGSSLICWYIMVFGDEHLLAGTARRELAGGCGCQCIFHVYDDERHDFPDGPHSRTTAVSPRHVLHVHLNWEIARGAVL